MFWGNIAALIQKNIKRMMAYSSIAHAGYLAIGLAAWGEPARMAVLFYLVVYVFMNAAAFGLILLVRKGGRFGEDVDDLRGLAGRSPLAAAVHPRRASLPDRHPADGRVHGQVFPVRRGRGKGMFSWPPPER